jgi:FkbM family methyltransferase
MNRIIVLLKRLTAMLNWLYSNRSNFAVPQKGISSKRYALDVLFNICGEYADSIDFEREGIKWILPTKDKGISKKIFSNGSYEKEATEYIASFLKKSEPEKLFILDVGANVGTPSILLAKLLKDYKLTIFSFEPVTHTYNYLCRNILNNRLEDVIIPANYGLGSENGFFPFNFNINGLATAQVITDYCKEAKQLFQIKTFLHAASDLKIEIDKLSFIWIDIEGFEWEFIKGSNNTLRQIPLFMEISPKLLRKNNVYDSILNYLQFCYHYFVPSRDMKSGNFKKEDLIPISELPIFVNKIESHESILFIKKLP